MHRMTFEHHAHATLHRCRFLLFFLFFCSLAHEFHSRTWQHPIEAILSILPILAILAILSAVVVVVVVVVVVDR